MENNKAETFQKDKVLPMYSKIFYNALKIDLIKVTTSTWNIFW
jgi:hypothetical protein